MYIYIYTYDMYYYYYYCAVLNYRPVVRGALVLHDRADLHTI